MTQCESVAVSVTQAPSEFATDARAGLTAPGQKHLPPKYLYDALGTALFEAITQLPEYGLWRAERQLLEEHAEEIAARTDATSVIELGSGSASKSAHLLRALLRRRAVSYWSIDLSAAALDMTRRELGGLQGLSVHGVESEYLTGLEATLHTRPVNERVLVLFLGSSLGNFDHLASLRFLRRVHRLLHPGDALLLGADLRKPVEQMLAAYDDALGVTAAFNLNLLVRMNRELGARFLLPQFRHRARFNAGTQDVEMHLESQCDQQVCCATAGFSASFKAGETIHTESSHKYSREELANILNGSGFAGEAPWVNSQQQFANGLYWAV